MHNRPEFSHASEAQWRRGHTMHGINGIKKDDARDKKGETMHGKKTAVHKGGADKNCGHCCLGAWDIIHIGKFRVYIM